MLIDVMSSPWAITSGKFAEIQEVYRRHIYGEKLDIEGITSAIGNKKEDIGLEVVGNVAIIPIQGVIGKKMNLLSEISGGVSTQMVERDFNAALNHPEVEVIVLDIDSPGGAVDGTPELANAIFEARGNKPIVAFSDGIMASAAFWIGAAADKVFISGRTVEVGSIGVVATHTDISKAEEKDGIKTTEIVAGKFKRIASQHGPLTKDGRDSIQESVDEVFSVFVSDVSKFRGVSEEKVLSSMADGRIFIGNKAVEAGLVDGIMTRESVLKNQSSNDNNVINVSISAVDASNFDIDKITEDIGDKLRIHANTGQFNFKTEEEMDITKEMISEKHPQIADAFRDEGFKIAEEAGSEANKKVGAEAERKRIKDVEAQCLVGHEALIETLKFDGVTTGPEAAVKVLIAEKSLQSKTAEGISKDAGGAVDFAEPGDKETGETTEAKGDRLVQEYMTLHKCDYREALLAVSAKHKLV